MKLKTGLRTVIGLFLCLVVYVSLISGGTVKAEVTSWPETPAVSSDGIVSWAEVDDATEYMLFLSDNNSSSLNVISDTSGYISDLSYNLKSYMTPRTNLYTPGQTYNFSLEAYKGTTRLCQYSGSYTYFTDAAEAAPVILPNESNVPTGMVGQAYNGLLKADSKTAGGVAAYTVWTKTEGNLPGGITLGASGTLYGTPTEAGTFTFTVVAANSEGSSEAQQFTITILAEPEYKITQFTVTAGAIAKSGSYWMVQNPGYEYTWVDDKAPAEGDLYVTYKNSDDAAYLYTTYELTGRVGSSGALDGTGSEKYYIRFELVGAQDGTLDFSGLTEDNCSFSCPGFDAACSSVDTTTNTGRAVVTFRLNYREYTVQFKAKYGDCSGAPSTVTSNPPIKTVVKGQTVAEPSKNGIVVIGYDIEGWYPNVNFNLTEKYDFSTPVTSDLTLYAHWVSHTEHSYNCEVATASYRKSAADCESPEIYYKSCTCGKSSAGTSDEATFEYGDALGHVSNVTPILASGVVYRNATCTTPELQYAYCDNDYMTNRHYNPDSSKAIAVGSPLGHSFTTKASDVKATDATTIAPATYYVKCDHCGEVSSTITVAVGSPLPAEEPVKILESEPVKDEAEEIVTDIEYEMLEGAEAVWEKGSGLGLTVRSAAEFSKFEMIVVDGEEVDGQNYEVSEGSTIVVVKAEYLETLESGTHTLAVVSTDGKAEVEFTIAAEAEIPEDDIATELPEDDSAAEIPEDDVASELPEDDVASELLEDDGAADIPAVDSAAELPKTGDISPAVCFAVGFMMMLCGVLVTRKYHGVK